jgi:N-methylhydantoinase A/oxoprolinase/acetone carboxylase beta subunit
VEQRFRAAHQLRYGYMLERSVEIVAVRVAAFGEAVPVEFGMAGEPAVALTGPAVVSLADATMVVAPGWTARALAIGGWMVERA